MGKRGNRGKKICPLCNYSGGEKDRVCPYCGVRLIYECPECRARIKTSFAEYCYMCGTNFKEWVKSGSSAKKEVKF